MSSEMSSEKNTWDVKELEKRIQNAREVLPPNATGLLPPELTNPIETVAKEQAVSPFMLLNPLLSCVAFLTAYKAYARPGPLHTHEVPVKWWSVVLAYSGSRKSAAHGILQNAMKIAAARIKQLTGEDPNWFHKSVSFQSILITLWLLLNASA